MVNKKFVCKKEIRAIAFGLLSALLILVLGFCVMHFLWINYDYPENLPGLFYYRSATIGDAICLPLAVGAIVTYILLEPKISKLERKKSIIVGVISSLFGFAMQMEWLISDSTKLNWTIPKQHYFNFPGWYHAIFFVFMFGLSGTLFAQLFFIKRKKPIKEDELLKVNLQAIVWFFLSLFMFLVATDDISKKEFFIVLIKVLIGILVGLYLFNVLVEKKFAISKLEISAILSGVFTAFATANIIIGGTKTDFVCVFVGALLMVVLLMPDSRKIKRMVNYYLLIVLPVVTLELAISSNDDFGINCVVGAFSILIPVLISLGQRRKNNYILMRKLILNAVGILLGIFLLICVYASSNSTSVQLVQLIEMIQGGILAGCIPSYVKETFEELVIKYENRESDVIYDNQEQMIKNNKIMMYTFYLIVFLGVLIFLCKMFFSDIPFINFPEYISATKCIVGIVIFFMIALILLLASMKKILLNEKVVICLGILAYVCLLLICASFNYVLNYDVDVADLCVICMWIGIPIVISVGFYNNLVKLQGLEKKTYFEITSIVIFVGLFALLPHYYLFLAAYPSIINIFILTVLVIFATVLIPYLMAKILMLYYDLGYNLILDSVSGVVQDGLLYGIAIILELACSCYFVKGYADILKQYSISNTNNDIALFSIAVIGAIVSFGLFFIWPIRLCINNNINHYNDKKKAVDKEEDNITKEKWQTRLVELKKHLTMQNFMTLFITFPYSLIAIAVMLKEYFKGNKRNIRDVFFPR